MFPHFDVGRVLKRGMKMGRYEETQRIVNSNINARKHRSLSNEHFALLRIERVLENIALNLAELNDKIGKQEGGHSE